MKKSCNNCKFNHIYDCMPPKGESFCEEFQSKTQLKIKKLKIEFKKNTLLDKINHKLQLVDPFLAATDIGHSERLGHIRLLFEEGVMSEWQFWDDIPMALFKLDNSIFASSYKCYVQNERNRKEKEFKNGLSELEKVWS